jgi:hypothetical protein
MKRFKDIIRELSEEKDLSFGNWIKPSLEDIKLEYKIEYEIKPLKNLTNNAFPTVESFIAASKKATVLVVTPSIDKKIAYRSHTRDKNALLSLIKGYASYPQYRNEKTLEAIYNGFKENKPMKMPIVLLMPNGSMRIMGGNTRADVATHLGLNWKALLITVPKV